jgi:hypothetical protein
VSALYTLTRWQRAMQTAEDVMESHRKLLLTAPESPFCEAIHGLMDDYTKLAAESVGCDPEWLTAWWLEHGFGAKPMRAGLRGEPLREIKTIEQLTELILADAWATE